MHDKIEFEIVHNCLPTSDDHRRIKAILNDKEYKNFRNSLINLTQSVFNKYDEKVNDLKSLKILTEKEEKRFLIVKPLL